MYLLKIVDVKNQLEEKKARLKELANVEFPAIARAENYPITQNHCFLRVVYDHLFQDKWQRILSNKKPAIHQLSAGQLDAAIAIGDEMLKSRILVERLNEESLKFREF